MPAILVAFNDRVVPVLDHVFGPRPVEQLRDQSPFKPVLADIAEQLEVLLLRPLGTVDFRVQMVEPLLPAFLRSAEKPFVGGAE